MTPREHANLVETIEEGLRDPAWRAAWRRYERENAWACSVYRREERQARRYEREVESKARREARDREQAAA